MFTNLKIQLMSLLYQNLALKSSEQVRNAGEEGEWQKYLTTPLWPRERSCFREAFRASQQHSEVVFSSGNMTKSSEWFRIAWAACSWKRKENKIEVEQRLRNFYQNT